MNYGFEVFYSWQKFIRDLIKEYNTYITQIKNWNSSEGKQDQKVYLGSRGIA